MSNITHHSPTPWMIAIDEDGAVNVATNHPEYTGDQICFVSSDYQDDDLTNVANAAHIVKCVNAYDRFYKALVSISELASSGVRHVDDYGEIARAAIRDTQNKEVAT